MAEFFFLSRMRTAYAFMQLDAGRPAEMPRPTTLRGKTGVEIFLNLTLTYCHFPQA
jgi:hypothetical protein